MHRGGQRGGDPAGVSAQKRLPLPDRAEGEIVIFGQGVSPGYTNLRSDAFGSIDGMPAYFTGDRGILKNGMLYFCGRSSCTATVSSWTMWSGICSRCPELHRAQCLPNKTIPVR